MEYIHFAEGLGWSAGRRDGSGREMVRGRTNGGSRGCGAEAAPRGGFVFPAVFLSLHSEVGERFNIPDNGYKSTFRPSVQPTLHRSIHPSTCTLVPPPHLPQGTHSEQGEQSPNFPPPVRRLLYRISDYLLSS